MDTQEPLAKSPLSFTDIIINTFASPSQVFEGLRGTESRVMVWLVPILLMIIVASLTFSMMMTTDSLKEQFMQNQRERVQEAVDAGRITQAQGDQQVEQLDQMGGLYIAIGIVGTVITLTLILFFAALVLWLVGKFGLKSPEGYGKYLELYGVSCWIAAFGTIVTLLLIIGLNTIHASPSAALAVLSNYSAKDMTHRILSSLNVFSLWQTAVIGIGLSKYSQKSLVTGISIAVVLWLITTAAVLGLSQAF
ncbi:MAG: YIP1 family protein [bacterium]